MPSAFSYLRYTARRIASACPKAQHTTQAVPACRNHYSQNGCAWHIRDHAARASLGVVGLEHGILMKALRVSSMSGRAFAAAAFSLNVVRAPARCYSDLFKTFRKMTREGGLAEDPSAGHRLIVAAILGAQSNEMIYVMRISPSWKR